MKITVIHGSPRKGNTYHAAQIFMDEMKKQGETEFFEFFLPKDMPEFCKGCMNCVLHGEQFCPHAKYRDPILEKMVESDALIFTTPVYVMRESGGMKAFLDHFPFLFIVHRAKPEMFHKKAFILSTTAGAGTGKAMKAIEESLKYWGVNRVYKKGFTLFSGNWKDMKQEKQDKFERQLRSCARKFQKDVASHKDHLPYIKTRFMFTLCKKMPAKCDIDRKYWEEQGWLNGKSPFKK